MADESDGAGATRNARGKASSKAKPKAKRKAAPARPGTKPRAAKPASPRPAPAKGEPRTAAAPRGAAARPRRAAAAPGAKAASGKAAAAAKRPPARPAGAGRRTPPAVRRRTPPPAAEAPADNTLTEEERIESAKYQASSSRPRVFEEERFLFPESYGVDRVRLHVKDPEWLFAHWDVNPATLAGLRAELGDRAMALSRLTLRVSDTRNGGESLVLLPPGARSWYVRTASGQRAYRAELGFTLPSGEFRRVAESNVVVAPRVGPSPDTTGVRRTYKQARAVSAAAAKAAAAAEQVVSMPAGPPWSVPPEDAGGPGEPQPAPEGSAPRPGGASDVFRR